MSRICFWSGVCILMICGNGWVAGGLLRRLEWRYLPSYPLPHADCIVILSGGILPRIAPRPTIEVADAGDRVLYGSYLYRKGMSSNVICTGNAMTPGVSPRAAAEEMAEFLEILGLPKDAIIKETQADDTHEHAKYLYPVFKQRSFSRILLVTSALHMPRAVGVFKRLCPGIEIIPAPTDFRMTMGASIPWHRKLSGIIPTPKSLADFSDAFHEYLGMAYYRMRGWL